jgi:hypothetical protein
MSEQERKPDLDYGACLEKFNRAVSQGCLDAIRVAQSEKPVTADSIKVPLVMSYNRLVKPVFEKAEPDRLEQELGRVFASLVTHIHALYASRLVHLRNQDSIDMPMHLDAEFSADSLAQAKRHMQEASKRASELLVSKANRRAKAELFAALVDADAKRFDRRVYPYARGGMRNKEAIAHPVLRVHVSEIGNRGIRLGLEYYDGVDYGLVGLGAVYEDKQERASLKALAEKAFDVPAIAKDGEHGAGEFDMQHVEFSTDFTWVGNI